MYRAVSFLLFLGDQFVVNTFAFEVDGFYAYGDLVAEAVALARVLADDAIVLFFEYIEVVAEVGDAHETLTLGFVFFHKDTPLSNTGDGTLECFSNTLIHILCLLELDRGALGVGSKFFHLG